MKYLCKKRSHNVITIRIKEKFLGKRIKGYKLFGFTQDLGIKNSFLVDPEIYYKKADRDKQQLVQMVQKSIDLEIQLWDNATNLALILHKEGLIIA